MTHSWAILKSLFTKHSTALLKIPTLEYRYGASKNGPVPFFRPLAKTRFAVAFGKPLHVRPDLEPREAQKELEARWRQSIAELTEQLRSQS
jgi:hypothetical protein